MLNLRFDVGAFGVPSGGVGADNLASSDEDEGA